MNFEELSKLKLIPTFLLFIFHNVCNPITAYRMSTARPLPSSGPKAVNINSRKLIIVLVIEEHPLFKV